MNKYNITNGAVQTRFDARDRAVLSQRLANTFKSCARRKTSRDSILYGGDFCVLVGKILEGLRGSEPVASSDMNIGTSMTHHHWHRTAGPERRRTEWSLCGLCSTHSQQGGILF